MKLPILGWTIDERFLTHRLRSTSIGGMAAVVVAGGLFFYHLVAEHQTRWELFAIIATAAVVKMSLMVWYHMTD
ncbi:MAG: hypothetical protein WBX15_19460 [Thermoanaerobaculia bacterium]